MQPALVLPPEPDVRWDYATQTGVEHAVVHTLEIGDGRRPHEFDDVLTLYNRFADSGIELSVFEGGVPVTDVTRLGLDGREDEIARFKELIRSCGQLDIPVICYDWMPGLRWARTSDRIPARGGSFTTGYDDIDMNRGPRPPAADIDRETLWENLEYFLEEVIPVAEDAGVRLGLHPDDPPRPEVRGVPRIAHSVENYERIMDLYPSEANAITFCQGNFAAMGVDVPATIRRLGEHIAFVHFRDVEGDADEFVETWHDAGPTDMQAAVEAYHEVGFDGPARPDHVPTMAGEDNSNPGYHPKGRIFAIGYMRGLIESVEN